MKIPKKDLIVISSIFLMVFMGYSSCQQYLTNYLDFLGYGGFGFYILIMIYLFFMVGNVFYNKISSYVGIKKTMQIGIIMYILFIISLYIGNPYGIIAMGAMTGFGASLLWTGSNIYIVLISSAKDIGKNAGFFNTLYALGITLGSIVIGYLIGYLNYQYSFLIFSILPIGGLIFSLFLKNIKNTDQEIKKDLGNKKEENLFSSIKKCIKSKLVWKVSIIWFTTFFIYGLAISFLPVQIKNIFGIEYVGFLSALFFSFLLFFSYLVGKISDRRGRRKIILRGYIIVVIGLVILFLATSKIRFIVGVCCMAIFYTGMNTLIFSLIGDISSKKNIGHLTPFFWMIQNVGAIAAIFLSKIFLSNMVYIISLSIICINVILLYRQYKLPIRKIKEKIDMELL